MACAQICMKHATVDYSNLNGGKDMADLRSCITDAKVDAEVMNAECASMASTRTPTPVSSDCFADDDTECREPVSAQETVQEDHQASDLLSAVLVPKRPAMAYPKAKPRFQRHHHSATAPSKVGIPFAQCQLAGHVGVALLKVRRVVDLADISAPEFHPRSSAFGSVKEMMAKLASLAAAGKVLRGSWPARHAKAAVSASPTQLLPGVALDALASAASNTVFLLPRRLRSVATLEKTNKFKSKCFEKGKLPFRTQGPGVFSNMSTDRERLAFSSD